MIDSIIAKVKGFLTDPVITFQQSRSDEVGTVLTYFVVLLLVDAILTSAITFVGVSALAMFTGLFPGYAVPVVIFIGVLIGGIVLTLIFSLWVHLWVIVVGGRNGLVQTVKAVMYGMTPGLLLGWIPVIGFVFTLWSLILEIIGIRELQEISSGRALAVVMITVMVPLVILVILAAWFFVSSVTTSPVSMVPPLR